MRQFRFEWLSWSYGDKQILSKKGRMLYAPTNHITRGGRGAMLAPLMWHGEHFSPNVQESHFNWPTLLGTYPKADKYCGSSRLCVIIFAYGIVKCLLGKTFSRHSAHLHIPLYIFTFPKMFWRKSFIVETTIENIFNNWFFLRKQITILHLDENRSL